MRRPCRQPKRAVSDVGQFLGRLVAQISASVTRPEVHDFSGPQPGRAWVLPPPVLASARPSAASPHEARMVSRVGRPDSSAPTLGYSCVAGDSRRPRPRPAPVRSADRVRRRGQVQDERTAAGTANERFRASLLPRGESRLARVPHDRRLRLIGRAALTAALSRDQRLALRCRRVLTEPPSTRCPALPVDVRGTPGRRRRAVASGTRRWRRTGLPAGRATPLRAPVLGRLVVSTVLRPRARKGVPGNRDRPGARSCRGCSPPSVPLVGADSRFGSARARPRSARTGSPRPPRRHVARRCDPLCWICAERAGRRGTEPDSAGRCRTVGEATAGGGCSALDAVSAGPRAFGGDWNCR